MRAHRIIPGVTQAQLEQLCATFMANRSVSQAGLSLSVADLDLLSKGELLKVTVTVPANSNALSSSLVLPRTNLFRNPFPSW